MDVEKVLEEYLEGGTLMEIARRHGVTDRAVRRWVRVLLPEEYRRRVRQRINRPRTRRNRAIREAVLRGDGLGTVARRYRLSKSRVHEIAHAAVRT